MAFPRRAVLQPVYDTPRQAENPRTGDRQRGGLAQALERWYQLTAPDYRLRDTGLAGRELVRRGRLASIILLGMVTIWIFYLPVDLASGYGAPTLVVFAGGLLVLSGLLAMNRRGLIRAVALCLMVPIDAGFLAIQLSTAAGAGPAERAGSFPILIFAELVAAALLSPALVFLTAFVNCLVLLLAILTWPDAVRTALFIGSSPSTLYNIVVGAPATQFIIALVLFLFTSSALNALRRADRAEQVADMQRQLEERQRLELQDGAEHIRQVLANVSNGNYHARVIRVANPLLWQIGTTLNTFVGRLDRLEFESYTLQRESKQAHRVADAIQMWRGGRLPIWPAPTGLPVDAVIAALVQPANPAPAAPAMPFEPFAPGSGELPPLPSRPSSLPNQGPMIRPWPWEPGPLGQPGTDGWPGNDERSMR